MKLQKSSAGPLGILARFIPGHEKPLGRQTQLIQGFFKAADTLGYQMGLFHPETLADSHTPVGHTFRNGKWIEQSFDFPEAVYDRFYSSIKGPDKKISALKKSLETNRGVLFLNPVQLAEMATDKLAFAEFLQKTGIAAPGILERKLPAPEKMWDHIQNEGAVIVKPRYGRMGQGIFRIYRTRRGAGIHSESGFFNADNPWHLNGFLEVFLQNMGLENRHFILQKHVSMPVDCNRFFDIRILMQRTAGATPVLIAGEVARVGGAGDHVPNIDFGGLAMPVFPWLKRVFGKNAETLHETLHAMAFDVYEALEKQFGKIGELGLDMLIDGPGRIWLIEVNSKPGRIAFERLAAGFGLSDAEKRGFAEQRKNSILNPVTYIARLSEQKGDGER